MYKNLDKKIKNFTKDEIKENSYLFLKKEELLDVLLISMVIGFLFTISFMRFEINVEDSFLWVFFSFFIFIFVMLYLRLKFIKFIGYRNAFEIDLRLIYFNRYWFENWHKISYSVKSLQKGVPVLVLSIFIYFLTLGSFIFPAVWNYNIKKIPHLFIGSRKKFENSVSYLTNIEISDYRFSKALFAGFLFYYIFGLLLKTIFVVFFSANFYNWITYILYWFAFWTIIPVFGTEGYELFRRNRIAWICGITLILIGMTSLLIFESIFFTVFFGVFSVLFAYTVMFWKDII